MLYQPLAIDGIKSTKLSRTTVAKTSEGAWPVDKGAREPHVLITAWIIAALFSVLLIALDGFWFYRDGRDGAVVDQNEMPSGFIAISLIGAWAIIGGLWLIS